MKIDTEIRHITPVGTNIFAELGFSSEEAGRLNAESRKQIAEQISEGHRISFKETFARDGLPD